MARGSQDAVEKDGQNVIQRGGRMQTEFTNHFEPHDALNGMRKQVSTPGEVEQGETRNYGGAGMGLFAARQLRDLAGSNQRPAEKAETS